MFSTNRRYFLQASGLSLSLPYFASLKGAGDKTPPKRFCNIYFPWGASNPNENHADGTDWSWYPSGEGKNFKFRKSLEHMEPLREHITIIKGLSHPRCRRMGGHDTADTFLTGVEMSSATGMKNAISLDQFMARNHQLGQKTRFTSLVLSTDGGVGMPLRSRTMSFDNSGNPIPAINKPAMIFDRLFGTNPKTIKAQRLILKKTGSHLDYLTKEAKSLNAKLNNADRHKLDHYLTSVREVEQEIERASKWLTVKPEAVSSDGLKLDATGSMPDDLIKTMLDIIILAFQTDSTRFVTYQLGAMNGASLGYNFPLLIGLTKNWHALNHRMQKHDGAAIEQGKWDQYLAKHLYYFLDKMSNISEANGSLLDNTCVLYGSSVNTSHDVSSTYPIMLAGGKNMGYKHGQFLTYDKNTPLSNLFVTIAKRMGTKINRFSDSTGEINEV